MSEIVRILLLEGNARQILPMAKNLRRLGHYIVTLNSSCFDFGYVSRYPNKKYLKNYNVDDEEGTLNIIKDIIINEKIDLIIPMNDDIAILLSKYKHEFTELCEVAVNDWDIFNIASDKLQTMNVCMQNNIPCPITALDKDSYIANKESFKYPVVIKPRTGCGAVGFHVAENEADLMNYLELSESKYGPCLVQEYIPQTDLQYKAELYIDKKGDVKSAIVFAKVRWYPIDGGSSTLNVTVSRADIVESCSKLLKKIGWRGYADIDLIQDPRDGKAKVIEINPRITGSVKICFKAGVDFASQIVDDYLGEEIPTMFNYKEGVYLRYIQKDFLWFIKSKNRFACNPSWFNFRKSSDQIFDINDPLPFIVSSVDAIPKLIKDKRKRSLKDSNKSQT